LNPGSPAPQASVLIQQTRKLHSDTRRNQVCIQPRLRARNKGRYAEEISIIPRNVEATIINTLTGLKANGITDDTLKHLSFQLKRIATNADIQNPETVKLYIANAKKQNGSPLQNEARNKLAYAYDKYCQVHHIAWQKPYYKVEEKTPLIPTTENVNAIINTATENYAVIFTILAETGAEGRELENVSQSDIDTEQGLISIRGHKGHASGTYKLKTHTAEMLRTYLNKHKQERPFPRSKVIGDIWRRTRARAVKKLCKPELSRILLQNLRNYSGAQLYYRTQDPIAVMRHLRHKKLETTMHYIRGITLNGEEEYTTKAVQLGTPTTIKEITELSDAGYQYYTEADGYKLFRKRK
jgi:integrase